MSKFKKLIAIITVLLFALSIIAPVFAQGETTTNPVYDEAAKVLKDKGVMQGNQNGDLMLTKALTRAEVVTMILRSLGQEAAAEEYADADASFKDTANHWSKKYVELAKEMGIVNGYPDGTFRPEQKIKFEELCKLLVAAMNETPAAGKWPLNYVRKALELGLFNGIEDEVGIGDIVIRGQAAVAFQSAFFQPEKQLTVKNVQALSNTSIQVDIAAAEGQTLADGDVAAVDFDIKDAANESQLLGISDVSFDAASGKAIIKTAAQEAGKTYKLYFRGQDTTKTFVGLPADLNVAEVSTDNLKAINVKFNDKVDSTTLTTDNIKIANHTIESIKLLDDGKTAVVVVSGNIGQFEKISLSLDNIKSIYGKVLSGYTKELVVSDIKRPELLSASALNYKTVKLMFSEPINQAIDSNPAYYPLRSNIKIDGQIVAANIAAVDQVEKSITLKLYSPLAKGTHVIEVSGLVDFASFSMDTKNVSFDVAEDVQAPFITNVALVDSKTFEITFNEMLDQIGTFKVNGVAPQTVTPVADSNNTKFTLKMASSLPFGTRLVAVSYVGQTDLAGNSVSTEQTKYVEIADDTTSPDAKVEMQSNNDIEVTFTKPIRLDFDSSYQPYVKLLQGTTEKASVAINPAWFGTTQDTMIIPAATFGFDSTDVASYTLRITGIKDASIRQNPMADKDFAISVADTKKPNTAPYFAVTQDAANSDNDFVTLYFTEAMDASTLANASNYIYNDGTADKPLGSLASFVKLVVAQDKKSVQIYMKNARTIPQTATFKVFNLKDLAGNTIVTDANGFKTIAMLPNQDFAVAGNVYAVSLNEIKVTFNRSIGSINPASLKLVYSGTPSVEIAVRGAVVDPDNNGSTNVAKLTLAGSINATDVQNYTLVALANAGYVDGIVDTYGKKLAYSGAYVVNDQIKPTVTVATGDNAGEIKVTFSETVAATYADIENSIIISKMFGDYARVKLQNGVTYRIADGNESGFKTIVLMLNGISATDKQYSLLISAGLIKDKATTGANDIVPVLPSIVSAK
ncbi:S-layer homology domain-containing protein [Caldicellulosiruptoraceae bacterium PP1]